MFFWVGILVWIYVSARLIYPLPIGAWRIVAALALLVVLRHHYVTYILWGSMFSPEVPRFVVIGVNWIFGGAVVLAALLASFDAAALLLTALRKRKVRVPLLLRAGLSAVALSVSGYAVSSAIVVPKLKEIEVQIADLPMGFEGFRVVHLTDLHISRLFDANWAEQVVEQVNSLDPDMIVVPAM